MGRSREIPKKFPAKKMQNNPYEKTGQNFPEILYRKNPAR
jgi:hypothetical protein